MSRRRIALTTNDSSDNNNDAVVKCPNESPILISPSPMSTASSSTSSYNNNNNNNNTNRIPSTSSSPKLNPRSSATTIPIYHSNHNHNNSRSSSSPSRLDPGGSRGTNTRPTTTKMTTKSMTTTANLNYSPDKQHHHDHDHNGHKGHNSNNGNNGNNGQNHNGHGNPKHNIYRKKKIKMGVVLRTFLILIFICILGVIALHRQATQLHNSLDIDDKPSTTTNTQQQQSLSLKQQNLQQQRLNQKDKFLDYAKQRRKVKEVIPETFKLISIFDNDNRNNNNNSNNTTSIQLQLRVPVIVDQKEILRHISFTYNDEIITKESTKSNIKLCNYQPFRGNQLDEIPKLIKSYDYYNDKNDDDENRFVDDNKNDGGLGFPAARCFDYMNANYHELHQSSKVDFLPPSSSSSPISISNNPDIISSDDPNPDNPTTTFDISRYRPKPQLYSAAVCQIRPSMKSQLLQHFVHAMEELLKCFDYWIECNSNSGKYYYRSSNSTTNNSSSSSSTYFQFQPILLYEEIQGEYLIEKGFKRNPFLKGIYELLTTSTLNVIVMSTNDYYGNTDSSSNNPKSIVAVNNNNSITDSTNTNIETKIILSPSKYYHSNQTIRTYRSLGENGFLMLYNQEWNILMDDYLLSLQQLRKKKIEKEALEKQRNDKVNLQKFMKMKIEQDALEKQRNDQVNIQRNHVKNLLLQSKLPPAAGTSEELPKRTATKRKVALKCPKHKKPGDAITFTNPHNPGQKLRVKVPKACIPGGTFKVTVPVLTSTLAADSTSSSSLQTTNTSMVQSRRRLMKTSSMVENTDSKEEEEVEQQQQQQGVYYGPATIATVVEDEVEVDNTDDNDNDNNKKQKKSNNNNEDDNHYLRPPRIGILNRMDSYTSGRTILNWKELAYQLSKISYVFYNHNHNNNHNNKNSNNNTNNHTNTTDDENSNEKNSTVQVTFFEGKTFEEQIQFFRNTDILISPHGAQLTGLIFMSSSSSSSSSSSLIKSNSDYYGEQQHQQQETRKKSCKHIMELFPKNYAIPYYFGSLAVQSGIRHSYVYYDDGITKINITETDASKSHFDRNKDNTDNDDPLDAYNKKLKRLNKQIRYSRNPCLKELMPWERIIPKDYIKRRNARTQVKFCPRQNDMNNMVIELIMDWYKCRRRRLLVVDNVR